MNAYEKILERSKNSVGTGKSLDPPVPACDGEWILCL